METSKHGAGFYQIKFMGAQGVIVQLSYAKQALGYIKCKDPATAHLKINLLF